MNVFKESENFIRGIFSGQNDINLHEPHFSEEDISSVTSSIKSSYVSTYGKNVSKFEIYLKKYTNAVDVVSTVNGTSALHLSLIMSGVKKNDFIISQAFNFVAAANCISYLHADPIFIDISPETLSICPEKLKEFFDKHTVMNKSGTCLEKKSKRPIRALIVMHTYGHPALIDKIIKICRKKNVKVIEDGAESLGTTYKKKHMGTFGDFGSLSFNGNKIITTGGGGALICKTKKTGTLSRHLSTTAKKNSLEFFHDAIGYNYRLPNLNASLGISQLKKIDKYILSKRKIANLYEDFYQGSDYLFFKEPPEARSNYWLNSILAPNLKERKRMINYLIKRRINVRPAWHLMNTLPMFKNSFSTDLTVSQNIWERLINLPSSPVIKRK